MIINNIDIDIDIDNNIEIDYNIDIDIGYNIDIDYNTKKTFRGHLTGISSGHGTIWTAPSFQNLSGPG